MATLLSKECLVGEINSLKVRNADLENELSETYRSVVELTLELEKAHQVADKASRLADIVALNVTLAHTINNALQGIIGYAELGLNKPQIDCDTCELFEVIRTEGLQIRDIVKRLGSLQDLHTTDYVQGTKMLDLGLSDDE